MESFVNPKGSGDNPSLLLEKGKGFSEGKAGHTDFWLDCEFGGNKTNQIRLDQFYGEFANTLIRSGKDPEGRNRIYLAMNPSGNRKTVAAKFVIAGAVDFSLPISRIVMDADEDQVIVKTGSPVDYRAQSLRRDIRPGGKLNRSRELLFETILPIVGEDTVTELRSILAVADCTHRTDIAKISVTPETNRQRGASG